MTEGQILWKRSVRIELSALQLVFLKLDLWIDFHDLGHLLPMRDYLVSFQDPKISHFLNDWRADTWKKMRQNWTNCSRMEIFETSCSNRFATFRPGAIYNPYICCHYCGKSWMGNLRPSISVKINLNFWSSIFKNENFWKKVSELFFWRNSKMTFLDPFNNTNVQNFEIFSFDH